MVGTLYVRHLVCAQYINVYSEACQVWSPYKQATLYINTARLMGPKVSIACVWACV